MSSGSHNFFKPYQPRVYGNKYCMKKTLINGALHVLAEQWNPPAERIVPERNWAALLASGRELIPVIRIQGALAA